MSRRPCWQCGHTGEEQIGADQFEEEVRIVQSVPNRVFENNERTLLPPWAEGLFDNFKRGYIENGKYKCRVIHFQTPSVDSAWHPQALREATARDLELNPIYNLLSTFPDCPDRDRLAYLDEITKSYCADWKRLKIHEGLLYRRWYNDSKDIEVWQLIPPTGYRQMIFDVAHKSVSWGHFGFQKTRDRIQSKYYWSGCSASIQLMCVQCNDCAQFFWGNPPDLEYFNQWRWDHHGRESELMWPDHTL